MSWTYVAAQIATVPLYQVRRLIGDVLSGDQQMQDEEINWSISQRGSVYGGAAECCRNIAAQLARQVDLVQGELKNNYSQRSKQYFTLSRLYEQYAQRGVQPYAGGISVQDKDSVAEDPDRTPPSFNRGQFDDTLPVGPVGEQTPTGSPPDVEPAWPV